MYGFSPVCVRKCILRFSSLDAAGVLCEEAISTLITKLVVFIQDTVTYAIMDR